MNFIKIRAVDFCKSITDGTHDSPKRTKTGKPLVTSKHLSRYGIDFDSTYLISESDYKKVIARSRVDKWDVLYSMIGTIGNIYIETSNNTEYACKNVGIFKMGGAEYKSKWLYYYLQTRAAQEYILGVSRGTTQGYVPLGALRELQIPITDSYTMNRITSVLWEIDEKIKNNRAINHNLQQQIQALFSAWFCTFEPFGGTVPSNWSTRNLSEIAEFVGGYAYKGNELMKSTTVMATIKNFERTGGFKLDGFKEIRPSNKLKSTQRLALYDILVAHTDLTQNAEVIGNAEMVMSLLDYHDAIFSMDLVKVVPKPGCLSQFLLAALLQNRVFKAHCLGYVNGTTVLHLSKKALPEYKLLLPNDLSVLSPLDKAITALYLQISANIEENSRLELLRETLLPQLMSGEIDVSNIKL